MGQDGAWGEHSRGTSAPSYTLTPPAPTELYHKTTAEQWKLGSKCLQKWRKGGSLAMDWRNFIWGKGKLAPQGVILRIKAQLPLSDTNLQAAQQKLFDSINPLLKVIQEGFSLKIPSNPSSKHRKPTDPNTHIWIISQELLPCSAFLPQSLWDKNQRNSPPSVACSQLALKFRSTSVAQHDLSQVLTI